MKIDQEFIKKHDKELKYKIRIITLILYLKNYLSTEQYSFSKFINIIFDEKLNESMCVFNWYTTDIDKKNYISQFYIPVKYLYDKKSFLKFLKLRKTDDPNIFEGIKELYHKF